MQLFCHLNDSVAVQSRPQGADDDILGFEVSDAALEAAANTAIPGGALSFPNAPTVSILIICCSIDGP
jgi:hypothetical protein